MAQKIQAWTAYGPRIDLGQVVGIGVGRRLAGAPQDALLADLRRHQRGQSRRHDRLEGGKSLAALRRDHQ